MSNQLTANELARRTSREKIAVQWTRSTFVAAVVVTLISVVAYARVHDYRRPGPLTLSEGMAALGLVVALLFIGGTMLLWRRRKLRFVACVRQLREYSEAEASMISHVPLRVLLLPARAGRPWFLCSIFAALLFVLALGLVLAAALFNTALLGPRLGAYEPLIFLLPAVSVWPFCFARARWRAAIHEVLRRGSRATCLSCGYLREGLPWETPCPECGTPHSIARFHYINAYWNFPIA